MNQHKLTAQAQQLALHLKMLERRLKPDAYALLLRVLWGMNDALAQRGGHVDIEFSPEERALFTPEFQRELIALTSHLRPAGVRVRFADLES